MKIDRKRELVIVSCGGYPYDINLIQAHKSLDMAAHACTDGGTIVLLAECRDGLGHPTFLNWFEEKRLARARDPATQRLRSKRSNRMVITHKGRALSNSSCFKAA